MLISAIIVSQRSHMLLSMSPFALALRRIPTTIDIPHSYVIVFTKRFQC